MENDRNALPVSAETKLYCLLGDPVSHSLSPFIMNRAFGETGLAGRYAACRVRPDALADAVRGLRAMGFAGANVTFPHKEAVVPLLDSSSTCVRVVGACNTVELTADGLSGHNTDAPGAVIAIERLGGLSLSGRRVLIFGAGGAGRAVAFGALEAMAASVTFCVRDSTKAERVTASLKEHFGDGAISVIGAGGDRAGARMGAVAGSDVLINATPLGMPGYGAWSRRGLIDDPAWIRPGQLYLDLVYGVRRAGFLSDPADRGAVCLTGVSHLIAQASEAFRIWTGRCFDLADMAEALKARAATDAPAGKE